MTSVLIMMKIMYIISLRFALFCKNKNVLKNVLHFVLINGLTFWTCLEYYSVAEKLATFGVFKAKFYVN